MRWILLLAVLLCPGLIRRRLPRRSSSRGARRCSLAHNFSGIEAEGNRYTVGAFECCGLRGQSAPPGGLHASLVDHDAPGRTFLLHGHSPTDRQVINKTLLFCYPLKPAVEQFR